MRYLPLFVIMNYCTKKEIVSISLSSYSEGSNIINVWCVGMLASVHQHIRVGKWAHLHIHVLVQVCTLACWHCWCNGECVCGHVGALVHLGVVCWHIGVCASGCMGMLECGMARAAVFGGRVNMAGSDGIMG